MLLCNTSGKYGENMKNVTESEQELRHYLKGIVEGWHRVPTPTEQELWQHVNAIFARVESEEQRQQLQERTVDLLEEALTYTRLDA